MNTLELQRQLDVRRAALSSGGRHRTWEKRKRNAESLRDRCANVAQAASILARGPIWVDPQTWAGVLLVKRQGGRELPLSPSAQAVVRVLVSLAARGKPGLWASAREVATLIPGRAGTTSHHGSRASVWRAVAELEAAGLINRVHQFRTSPFPGQRWRDRNAWTLTMDASARVRRRGTALRNVASIVEFATSAAAAVAGRFPVCTRPPAPRELYPETRQAQDPPVSKRDDDGEKRHQSKDLKAPKPGLSGQEVIDFARSWREVLHE